MQNLIQRIIFIEILENLVSTFIALFQRLRFALTIQIPKRNEASLICMNCFSDFMVDFLVDFLVTFNIMFITWIEVFTWIEIFSKLRFRIDFFGLNWQPKLALIDVPNRLFKRYKPRRLDSKFYV